MRAFCAALLIALPAMADDLNSGPMTVSVLAGGVTTLTGADDTANIKGTGWIETELPLGLVRPYSRLGITARPAQELNLADVGTFSDAEVGLGLQRVVLRTQDRQGTFGWIVEGGFSSVLNTEDAAEADRLTRYYMVGVKFQHASGGELALGYGRDESAGPIGWGQVIGYGALPLSFTRDSFIITGEFTLCLEQSVTSRDTLKLGVMLDLGRVVAAVRDSP